MQLSKTIQCNLKSIRFKRTKMHMILVELSREASLKTKPRLVNFSAPLQLAAQSTTVLKSKKMLTNGTELVNQPKLH